MKRKMPFEISFCPCVSGRRGTNFRFTIVELLIVISIIIILISILMPALKKARDAGKSISCCSNQKQLALAFNEYASDFNGWIPAAFIPYIGCYSGTLSEQPYNRILCNFSPSYNYAWLNYVGVKTFRCPSALDILHGWGDKCGYGINRYLGEYWDDTGATSWKRFSNLSKPSRDILLVDIDAGKLSVGSSVSTSHSFRHNDGSNFLYCDGHVKWLRGATVSYTSSGDYKIE